MTLGYSRKFKADVPGLGGHFTNFEEKIKSSLYHYWGFILFETHNSDFEKIDLYHYANFRPKRHSIREDSTGRWFAGRLIHSVYGNRTKNRRQFIPTIKCRLVQKISIEYHVSAKGMTRHVYIDGKEIIGDDLVSLAHNDGFNNLIDFFSYFSKDFKGVLIHWTDLKY